MTELAVMFSNWRKLPTPELEDRIREILCVAADTRHPQHLGTKDWAAVDRMRAELKARQKVEKAEVAVDTGDGAPQQNPVGEHSDAVLAEHTRAIHELAKRTRENIIEIGRHLVETRDQVDRGAWLTWLEAEFGWSDQTAYRFIHVYELSRDARFHTCVELDLPLGVLYQLAAPRAEDARQEIAERFEAGEQVSRETVIQVITGRRKPPATEPDRATSETVEESAAESGVRRKAENARPFDEDAPADSPDAEVEHNPAPAGSEQQVDGRADADSDRGDSGDDPAHGGDAQQHLETACGGAAHDASAPPSVNAKSKLLKAWEAATLEERQQLRDQLASLSLLELWEVSTAEEQQPVRERVFTEFFTDTVAVRACLDRLGVEKMLGAMSDDFGRDLRARIPAKSAKREKPFKKTLNLSSNPAHPDAQGFQH